MQNVSLGTNTNSPLNFFDFRLYLVTRLFSTFSLYSLNLALCWQILDLTKSPLYLGLLGLSEFIPHFLTAFWGGFVTDRNYQKYILILCNFSFFLISSFLAAINYLNLPLSNPKLTIIFLFLSMSSIGVVRGFFSPAVTSYLALLVPRTHYAKSSAWNNVVWQVAAISGPAIGGLIYGTWGVYTLHTINSISMFISLLNLVALKNKGEVHPSESSIKFLNGIRKGFEFILKERALLGALLLDLFGVLFGGAVALLPIYADTILNVGPQGLGYLRAAPALGSLIASFFLVKLPPIKYTGKIYLYSMSAFGLCMIGFAFSKIFLLSLFYLFFSGAFDSVSVVVRTTLIQYLTPEQMRGKIGAINTIFIGSSNELGDFESGVTAHFWGVVRSIWIGGLLTQVVVLVIYKYFPQLRNMEFRKLETQKTSL